MSHTGRSEEPIAPEVSVSTSQSTAAHAPRPLTRSKDIYYGDGITEYVYTPRKGKVQRVCGILGKDKRSTIEIVKKGFPDLAEIETERFDFEIYNARRYWVKVMEEAWELLNRDPPLVWVIKIQETTEEKEQRVKPQKRNSVGWTFFLIKLSVILLVIVIMAKKAGFTNGYLWGKMKYAVGTAVLQSVIRAVVGI